MSGITGAKSAKKAAAAQEAALKEQTKQATEAANEAARQSAASAANAAARDAASQQLEADTLANKPGDVEVDLTTPDAAPTRKRAKFNAGGGSSNGAAISI